MLVTVFTPTHRPDYLADAHRSLERQTHGEFEWLVVPNGAGASVPDALRADPRVRVLPAPSGLEGRIGALKRLACDQARGEILVELDHDDELASTALARIAGEVRAGAGFVYSDFANVRADGTCQVYEAAYGWTHHDETVDGRRVTSMHAFPCDAASLYQIFYAPNHVRAWTRAAYAAAGGHDPALEVCDDHDLLCRTYLAGVDMRRIPECLYLYRLQPGERNSYLERNAEIQAGQQAVGNRYFYRLVAEWVRRTGLPAWDLGGRIGRPDGFRSIDLVDADLVHDVTEGLPFPDSSVGVIRAYDFLEHVPQARVVAVMNEIHRVLVPGGWLLSRTPSTDGRGAFQDPTHVSYWNLNSFWYYTNRDFARYVHGLTARYQGTRVWNEFPSDFHREHSIPYVYADLLALKGQPHPGPELF